MPIIIPTLSEIPSPQSPPHGGFFVWQLRNNYGSQEQANKPEFITTPPGHPFYVKERSDGGERPKPVGHEDLNTNWVGAGHLKIGDKIKQADDTTGVVANVTTVQQTQEMFNLTVDEAHTFYVGTNGWLVHNGDCGEKYVTDLVDAKGKGHILDGDATGGGHRPGTGIPGKSEFPPGWSDDQILHEITDVLTDPKSVWTKPDKRGYITTTGTRNGIDIQVVYDTNKGRIVSGYPTNVPRNPKK